MLRLTLSLILLAMPSLAAASADCASKSCAEGQIWDEATKACIKPSA